MTFKTKLFTLLIFGLLLLPIFINPSRTGQVLGISETTANGSEDQTNLLRNIQGVGGTTESVPKSAKIGEIGSGVYSTRAEESESTQTIEFTGRAIMNANTSISVSTDKFPLGSSISITVGGNTYNLVVQGRSVLSTDTILVLDEKTFKAIGGDVSIGSIDVKVQLTE